METVRITALTKTYRSGTIDTIALEKDMKKEKRSDE